MLNEAQYQELLAAIGAASRVPKIQGLPAVPVRIWFTNRDPVFVTKKDPVPEPQTITPSALAELWHSGALSAFSLRVEGTPGLPQTRCVVKCPTGEAQEASCSEDAENFRNCWDAVKARCKIESAELSWNNRGLLTELVTVRRS